MQEQLRKCGFLARGRKKKLQAQIESEMVELDQLLKLSQKDKNNHQLEVGKLINQVKSNIVILQQSQTDLENRYQEIEKRKKNPMQFKG